MSSSRGTPLAGDALSQAIQTAAGLLRAARHVVVFTGAGISTPSGIPDFRSAGTGLWERDNPMEVASLDVFQTRPERFYAWLRPLLKGQWAAKPNPAHIALAQMEAAGVIKAVITQNIDDLHQRAGSKNVYEVHGSLRTATGASCRETYPSLRFRAQIEGSAEGVNSLPRCPRCERVLKPDIVLFGEMLPHDTWTEAERHCRRADVILVAGSSLEVWPAASLPDLAVEHGARLIINNLSPTFLDEQADALLAADVAEVLPKIASLVL
ncbi:MAG: NAD-dependent deacylase [Chloroflexi bacterium]|nr:MAG: NAD-dependent deacylase [Chloroflexota bacterium]